MKHLSLSCRGGTWKKVCATINACCVLAISTGCSFGDFSKTAVVENVPTEPACLKSMTGDDAGVNPIAHWTFNDGQENGPWLDDKNDHPLVPDSDGVSDAAILVEYPRINGEGHALAFDGHQFARSAASADDHLYPPEFTLAAWVSLPAHFSTTPIGPYPFTWHVISASGDPEHCDGYQLDILFQDAQQKPTLVLTYQKAQAADGGAEECKAYSLLAVLDVPSWATGTGRWHHVAASRAVVGTDSDQLALFWDGQRIALQDPLDLESGETSSYADGERTLYIGASAPDSTSAAQTKFLGYMDDIAIFDRPLTEHELAEFISNSSTYSGPGNCQWRASEAWDDTAFDPSTADWSQHSPRNLSLKINDYDWGAGALDAHLWPLKDLQLYDKVYLDAYIPNDKAFQFTLASGDDYCTWVYLGRGQDTYEIDIQHPVNCASSTCEVNFHQVDRASVTSEWAIPYDSLVDGGAPTGQGRATGLEAFAIQRLEFVPASGSLPDWSSYGGVVGPNGWCWRLLAYEPETNAKWNQDSTEWNQSVTAGLYGPSSTGTRLAADFGDRLLDIFKCKGVTIEGDFESTHNSTLLYTFVIQDASGSWSSWDLVQNGSTFTVDSFAQAQNSSGKHARNPQTDNFGRFPGDGPDLHKIRLVGVQKPWGFYGGTLQITLRSLVFDPPDCEQLGAN